MQTLSQLTTILANHKDYLTSKYGITQLTIFGSYARDEQRADSDLDILIDYEQDLGIRFIDLAGELEQLLGLRVDLVSKKGIKPTYLSVIRKDFVHV